MQDETQPVEATDEKKVVTLNFDGVAKECIVTTDHNGEFVCETIVGEGETPRFLKFPEGDLNAFVTEHNEANPLAPVKE